VAKAKKKATRPAKKKPVKKAKAKPAKKTPAKKKAAPRKAAPKKAAPKKPKNAFAKAGSKMSPDALPKAAVSEPSDTQVDLEKLAETLAAISPRLAADPMFANEACLPFDANELAGYFTKASGDLGELFGDTLQGMIQSVRYAALHVVREVYRDDKAAAITTKPALELDQEGTLAVIGDLVVDGDLVNNGVLVVTGDLTVRGAYLGPPFDYSLAAVGGTMRARDVSTSGEILVGERLEASRIVHLLYNDYSSILPVLKTKALVIEDNFPALGTVEAEMQIDGSPSDEQLRAIFGASVDGLTDEDESPIRTLIKS
jgi:hypothetical protein